MSQDIKVSKTEYKGVVEVKKVKYVGEIYKGGTMYYSGAYDTPEQAAAWYNKMALSLYDVHAEMNQLPDQEGEKHE